MGIEKDLVKREVQRVNVMLTYLVDKINGLHTNNKNSEIEETDEFLKKEFGFTIQEIIKMDNSVFLKEFSELPESHIENLVELIYEIVMKEELFHLSENSNKNRLVEKAILLIDFLNKKSRNFSMSRMQIKSALQEQAV